VLPLRGLPMAPLLWRKAKPALTFADNGGPSGGVPHSPPGVYRSPCGLLSKHMAARIRVHLKDTTMDINNA
jgi:hypothetical protein